ncbi:MAG: hypothetical protein A2W99_16140 [Bacteroidetes bacterium GWF2_33_16]|nr:MAG: hypothetical protein A2X00_15485 [Bacteroidetes bacterium GWE2_32_14]OFY02432.1 MAG: hypothetical protein A2W99_16140 [Bacteroidetes bacterium GWF2_33_16]
MSAIFTINGQTLPKKVLLKGSSDLSGLFFTNTYEIGSNSVKTKTSQIKFQPSIGKFYSHYVFLGIYTEYGYQVQTEDYEDNEYDTESNTKILNIGPYFRLYAADLKFAPFLHVNIGYSRHTIEQVQNETEIPKFKMDGINYGVGVGMEYFIDKKFTFEFLLNYSYLSVREYVDEIEDAVSINNKGFEFRIGTSIILN